MNHALTHFIHINVSERDREIKKGIERETQKERMPTGATEKV